MCVNGKVGEQQEQGQLVSEDDLGKEIDQQYLNPYNNIQEIKNDNIKQGLIEYS